jgi:hypothetical protein
MNIHMVFEISVALNIDLGIMVFEISVALNIDLGILEVRFGFE